jgi:DNA-binding NarL/FixJ family response regulator
MAAVHQRKQVVDILVVDDEARARRALRALLATYPAVSVVAEAGNGADAIACAEATRPSVVLMDVHMPVMDGLEATRQIKRDHPEIAVLLITIDSAAEVAARAAGADDFLLKGLPGGDLVTAILGRVQSRPSVSGTLR